MTTIIRKGKSVMVMLEHVGAFLTSRGIGSAPVATLRSTVQRLEAGGIGAIWLGESTGREALTAAALILSATERVVVGTAIATMFGRDPQAAASGARTLADAWDERFVLGLGISHAPMVSRRGHDYQTPVSKATEYLNVLAAAEWTGPAVTSPPVLLAALGPRMMQVARDHADGAITWLGTVDHTREAREVLGSGATVAVGLAVAVGEGPDAARQVATDHVASYLKLANYRRHFRRCGLPDDPDQLSAELERVVVWGDASEVAARVSSHLHAGADHVLLNVVGADVDGHIDHLLRIRRALE